MRAVLPRLATLRRATGLPHRIVVDEAHYFLHDKDVPAMLDFELNGYTLVTYRASKLHPRVLASSEAVIVTRESHPTEVGALVALCQPCTDGRSIEHWDELLGNLRVGEAAVLPITEEAGGAIRHIRLAPRLTPHVRHLAKYVDIPVAAGRAFVFWRAGAPSGERAHTLREFVAIVEAASRPLLHDHLRRGDFSRWVADVFGDYPLATELRRLGERYRNGTLPDVSSSLAQAIRARYEFIDEVPPVQAGG
jgi:hypothetical protein